MTIQDTTSLTFKLQYLGIPLVLGIITRYVVWLTTSKKFLEERFLPTFSSLSLLGLLYTILVLFAYQGHHIIHNLRPVFRVFVPMILYFVIMWTSAFAFMYYLTKEETGRQKIFGYEIAVTQAFTAGSNNFVCPIHFFHVSHLTALITGAGNCCSHSRIWGQLGSSTRSNNRTLGRGSCAFVSHMGRIVVEKEAQLGIRTAAKQERRSGKCRRLGFIQLE